MVVFRHFAELTPTLAKSSLCSFPLYRRCMYINRVIIKNYRCLRSVDVQLNKGMNIIVGDNEAGKSTFLEAIHLSLTGLLYGRLAVSELHPFMFNAAAVGEWLVSLASTPLAPAQLSLHEPAYLGSLSDNTLSGGCYCRGVRARGAAPGSQTHRCSC